MNFELKLGDIWTKIKKKISAPVSIKKSSDRSDINTENLVQGTQKNTPVGPVMEFYDLVLSSSPFNGQDFYRYYGKREIKRKV